MVVDVTAAAMDVGTTKVIEQVVKVAVKTKVGRSVSNLVRMPVDPVDSRDKATKTDHNKTEVKVAAADQITEALKATSKEIVNNKGNEIKDPAKININARNPKLLRLRSHPHPNQLKQNQLVA